MPPRRRSSLIAVGAMLVVPFAMIMVAAAAMTVLVGITGSMGNYSNPGCGLQPTGSSTLISPMPPGSYQLTSGFGGRTNPVSGGSEGHRGQDFGAPAGAPITASAAGTVVAAGPASGFGQWVVIDHQIDGRRVSTVYGHMWPADVGVSEGEQVRAGQHIARVGSNGQSTGPHLHFEIWEGGRFAGGRAVDPMPLLSEPAQSEPAPAPPVELVASGAAPTVAQLMPLGAQGSQRSMPLDQEQLRNAATIVGVGKGMGMPPRAWVIAIATALQESTLHNLDYGDRDSVGLFQQRSSQGWGTASQILDPRYSASKFYESFNEKIVARYPDWQTMPVTQLAQQVQRSAFPGAYAKWETVAANAVLVVHGVAPIEGTVPEAC